MDQQKEQVSLTETSNAPGTPVETPIDHRRAPYGIFIAAGVFLIILLTGYLFFLSTNSLETNKESPTIQISPTADQNNIPTPMVSLSETDSSESGDIEEDLESIDIESLDAEMQDIEEEMKNL